jgi:hypothetical protein
MKHTLILIMSLLLAPLAALHAADTFLIENGQARAEIVIAEKLHPLNPCRTDGLNKWA